MRQQQASENNKLSHSLYEELEALKIRIAFAELCEHEIEEFDRELASALELDYSEKAQKRTIREIHRRLNKQLRKRFVRNSLTRTLNVFATALLLFFIGLTTAAATVHPVRVRLMEFIAQIDDHFTTTSFDYNENDVPVVPPEWHGEYYPYYIPTDFVLTHVDEIYNTVYYAAPDYRTLEFCEVNQEDYPSVDLEDDNIIDIAINGSAGIAKADKDGVAIVWGADDVYFSLYFSGDLEEAKRIAESVQHIP